MKVSELISQLQTLNPDLFVYGAPVIIERGHYGTSPHTRPFSGEWRIQGTVVRDAMNLERLESAVLLLVKK